MALTRGDLQKIGSLVSESVQTAIEKAVPVAVDKAVQLAVPIAVDKAIQGTVSKAVDEAVSKRFGVLRDEIENLIGLVIEEKTETLLVTKAEISHLPTKDEFYDKMDEVMGELKAIREENTSNSGRLDRHEGRITELEKRLQD